MGEAETPSSSATVEAPLGLPAGSVTHLNLVEDECDVGRLLQLAAWIGQHIAEPLHVRPYTASERESNVGVGVSPLDKKKRG